MPLGLRNLGAYILRYSTQLNGYAYLVTDRYPYSGQVLHVEAREPASPLPSRSNALRIGIGVALAALWAVAAYFLWRSAVPGNLDLPSINEDDYFSDEALDRADDYALFLRINFLLSQVVLVAVLGLAWRGAVRARVGGRAHRHRDVAQHDWACSRLARARPVRAGGPLVGPPSRRHGGRLPRMGGHDLLRAWVRFPVHLLAI